MRLASLSPFGPIFDKELRTTSRRKRSYFLRVFYLAGLFLFLMLANSEARHSYYSGAAERMQQQEQFGITFFTFFSGFCVGAMGLIGPVLTCTTVSSERLHKTLHVLLMTPINAWQIVTGKLFSRLLTAITLIGLSLPVLALVRLLGGVELQQMFGVLCVCAVTAVVTASIGLFYSTLINRAYGAILLSYATLLGMYLFGPMLAALWMQRADQRFWLPVFAAVNPFFTVMMVATGEGRGIDLQWWPCVAAQLAVASVFLGSSALILRRICRREGEGASPGAVEKVDEIETGAEPSSGQSSSASRSARTVTDNPILWHELRRPLMSRRLHRIIAVVLCLGLLLFTYASLEHSHDLTHRDTQIGFTFVFNALAMLLVCVLSGTAIAQEKEADTWTVLLASPVSAREIVLGKVFGVMRRMLWPMMLVVLHFALFVIGGVVDPLCGLLIIFIIVSFNLPWIATGVYLSLRAKKVTLAVILNLLLPIIAYAGTPLVLAVIASMNRTRNLVESVEWYLPYYYIASIIEHQRPGRYLSYVYLPGGHSTSVSIPMFVSITLGVAIAHVALLALIVSWTIGRFDRMVGRAPQIEPMSTLESKILAEPV